MIDKYWNENLKNIMNLKHNMWKHSCHASCLNWSCLMLFDLIMHNIGRPTWSHQNNWSLFLHN